MVERKKVLVGADPFPPYQYYDDQGNVQGTDYETVREAFCKAGYEPSFVLKEWAEIEEMMDAGELAAAFQVQKNPDREKRWLFSHLLRNAVTEVITAVDGLAVTSLEEAIAKQYKLGIIEGYSYGKEVDSLSSCNKIVFSSLDSLLQGVSEQEVHLAIFDKGVKEFLAQQMGLHNIRSLPALEFIRPLYVAFLDPAIQKDFNAARKI